MVVLMKGARVCSGVVALAVVAAVAGGCRARPLVADAGTIVLDGGGGAPGDGAVDQGQGTPRPLANGETCTLASDCASGFCVNRTVGNVRVCCNIACGGACSSCDSSGTCVFVPDGQRPNGVSSCYVDSATACFSDGFCDGAGSCRRREAGYPCGAGLNPSACDDDNVMVGRVCDGRGACINTIKRNCAPYACRERTGQCWDYCETDAQCAGAPCQPDGTCGGADAGTD
jgi:hypothetical protein